MGTSKLGELPWHNPLRVLLLGEIPQNTHRNKMGVELIQLEGVAKNLTRA
jgi:hypothetical protein